MDTRITKSLLFLTVLWNAVCAFPQDFLLATDWRRHDIYAIDLSGSENVPLNLTTKYPTAVAFNPITREMFWSENMMHNDPDPSCLNKVKLDSKGKASGKVTMPFMKNNSMTSGAKYITVDYMTGNVWMAHYPPAAIKVVDKTLMKMATVISSGLQKPTGIAVHPRLRKIYFCDQSRLTIETAYMDGAYRMALLQVETAPFGLTIDIDGERLYWLDDDMNALLSVDLNGNGLRMSMRGQYFFQSIVLDESYVYYTDSPQTSVQRISRYGQAYPMSMGNFYDGHMYSLAIHKRRSNLQVDAVCAEQNGGCPAKAVCLPAMSGYSCGENNMITRVPEPPIFVENVYRSSTRVTLSWNPPMMMVSSYLVRYKKADSQNMQEIKVDGKTNTCELRSLVPGTRYEVMIFGVNSDYVMSRTSARTSFTTESQRTQTRIVSGPMDVTTKANMDVMMHCEIDDFSNGLHLVWAKEDPGYTEIYSFKNGYGSLMDKDSKKYEVTMMGFKFFLKIKNVQWNDGLRYTCEIRGNPVSKVASNVVVFHDMEFMAPVLMEGTSGKFLAAGYYGSPKRDTLRPRQIPFMKCFIYTGEYLAGRATTNPGSMGDANYVMRWESTMTVYAENNNLNFTCRIGTVHPDFYVDFSTRMEVLYSVRNIRLMPLKSLYAYGDNAMCMADGNPAPEYVWTNSRMGMTVRSQTLELTGERAKNSWKCVASNVIEGQTRSTELQHTVRMKDQYCIMGEACRALCKNSPGTTMTDTMDYCCVTFAPCDGCTGYGPTNCQKAMCTAPSVFRNGVCEC